MASNPASDTHQYAFHSSTFIFHQFPLQSPQPVIFSVNGNREHTPEGIRPVLKAGNHGSEKPQRTGPMTTVLKTLIEEPVWIFDHGSQNPGRTGPNMTTVLKNLIEEPVWIFDHGSQNPGRTGLDT